MRNENKLQSNHQSKPQSKPERKPESKPDSKPQSKPESKPDSNPQGILRNKQNFFRFLLFSLSFLTVVLSCHSAAYFITPFIYKWIGVSPHNFLRYFFNVLLGVFLAFSIMFTIGTLTAPKRMAGIKSMIDALRRISKGDFNVKLPNHSRNDPFGEIVESINHMAVELNQMEQMRQEFISNVSHEIQSPLTSISGFAKVLQDDKLSHEERTHYLSIIQTESNRLAKLSDNLLKLTSLESEHHPFESVTYRLDKQLRNIILTCEPQWLEKAIEMDINLEETTISADPDMMSQVWVNLISNSIKFTPGGGTIAISLEKQNREIVVSISDTGIGISEEDQAHIFERFYKADKSRNRSALGSGLGLSIVKKIIDLHKGSIKVESRITEGTEVTLRLPADK